MDVIKENHKFLWDDEEADTWWVRGQNQRFVLEIIQILQFPNKPVN